MAQAFARHGQASGGRIAVMPRSDHWTARETVLCTVAASTLLWMVVLRAPALF
ncbi:MAG TPA: hypothetical protein PKB04_13585 [Phenylobacterium sp.]|nr:hypothetical protein [Phenylobacterium sp.]